MLRTLSYILLGYLLFRTFSRFFRTTDSSNNASDQDMKIDHQPEENINTGSGEYIDYEEIEST